MTVENIQQVRAVYDQATGQWELHIVCKHERETPDAPGDETAGVDLGICNFAAVAYSTDDADLYPGNRLKQDGYYFPKEIAKCDDSSGARATRLHKTWSERRTHFFHTLAKYIVERCVAKNVGRINIGELTGVCETDDGTAKNWGRHGNLDLHGWAFNRFTKILTYKAKVRGIEVEKVDERDTSKTCCVCGREDDSQRVERGLYVCDVCDAAFNADVNGAENIRVIETDDDASNSESSRQVSGIGVPAGWPSPRSTSMTSRADSNRKSRWWTANLNIPTLGNPRASARGEGQSDERFIRITSLLRSAVNTESSVLSVGYPSEGKRSIACGLLTQICLSMMESASKR